MATLRGNRDAFGRPGIEPRWTHGDKDGIGTAYSGDSRIWFTIWNGIVTETYFPTIDKPQLRDCQLLFTDGASFFHQETRYLKTSIERLPSALGYVIHGEDPEGRYSYEKEIIADPHLPCLLQRVRINAKEEWRSRLKVYVLCAPHLNVGGAENNAYVVEASGRPVLMAEKNSTWLAVAANPPFSRLSVGYVGASDGWTDLANGFQLDWEFDRALSGNVALTGEIDWAGANECVIGIAFGDSQHRAVATLFQSMAQPFEWQQRRFIEQWERTNKPHERLEQQSGDGGHLFHASCKLLLGHEDKAYQGAMVASLAIPWGEAKSDAEGKGGYHLVWTRDLVQCALGLLAAGNLESPLRALIYLATSQAEDGSFEQNFWVDGTPYWKGIQLDEVAFPILLAYRMRQIDMLREFDPYPMVAKAAAYLMHQGPATRQERWEEASGYSPSTLAAHIAALVCAAHFAAERGDSKSADYIEQFADWLEHNVENWTVTKVGTLLPDVGRHYIRIRPVNPGDAIPTGGDPGDAVITLSSQPPGHQQTYLAKEIIGPGFLELVRYGLRRANDPLIIDSLRVVDASLKVDTSSGTCWHRYTHDGYGQQEDGSPYSGYGMGGGWPLLAGERGHYELAAGRDTKSYIRSMEGFATPTHLIPEQVWDRDDLPKKHLRRGRPTGSAVPLLWAHAEYIKLLRSSRDGKVFDFITEVAERYLYQRKSFHRIQFCSTRWPATTVERGGVLRIQDDAPFRLHYSLDHWASVVDNDSTAITLGVHFCDVSIPADQHESIRFTLFHRVAEQWEGRDFEVLVVNSASEKE